LIKKRSGNHHFDNKTVIFDNKLEEFDNKRVMGLQLGIDFA
jgi:hypothetical protein